MIKLSRLLNPDDVWIQQNLLEKNSYQSICSYLNNSKDEIINNSEGRKFSYGDKSFNIKNTNEKHLYHLLWYLPYVPGYYDQTNDTISKWASTKYHQLMHPAVRYLKDRIQEMAPFSDYDGEWVVLRGVFNLLDPGAELWPHTDGTPYIMDIYKYQTYSATYYANVDREGGEFWDERGFIYKPINNSLLVNLGTKWIHGVKPSSQYRLGITMRFVKATDLCLPGSIDKLLYKPSM